MLALFTCVPEANVNCTYQDVTRQDETRRIRNGATIAVADVALAELKGE